MNIVFFGSSKLVIPIIEALHKNYDLKLVVTTEQKETGAVCAYCRENSIPYISVRSLSEEKFTVHSSLFTTDVAVLADFGLIIPDNILKAFPKGIINIHPSLLPKYRGPTPVQSAILAGDTKTGVSIIKLDKTVDHGPLLAQETEPISKDDTSETLHKKLFTKGAALLIETLPKYLSGELILTPQDDTKATFTEKLTRDSGYIDLDKLRINNYELRIERMIRAYYPWPGAWTLLRLSASEGQAKTVRVKLLPNNMLQVEGKKPMSYKDFLNGYPNAKNVILPIISTSSRS